MTFLNDLPITPSSILLPLALLFLLRLLVTKLSAWVHLPPGPWGFPVLGALPRLGKAPHLTIQNWWRRYGDVYSMKLGTRLVIVLNGSKTIRQCFVDQSDAFCRRPDNHFKKVTESCGIVFSEDETWREHRRFTASCLRDFGMGKVSLEHKINEEIAFFIGEILRLKERPLDPAKLYYRSVSNIICSIIYGSRFEYTDPVFVRNLDILEESTKKQTLVSFVNFIPWMEFLLKWSKGYQTLTRYQQSRADYAQNQIDSHRKTFEENYESEDFIEAYIVKMHELEKQEVETTFSEKQLNRTIIDLFIAGSETVSNTLTWALLLMGHYPDIQAKVQEEIDHVIGPGQVPSYHGHRLLLPYTRAVLMECQRIGNTALFSVPREVAKDTVVNGYHVPKGTWVFVNRWGLNMCELSWEDPERFDPGRFLDKDMNVIRPDQYLPFGIGPRNCIGEPLARMELFLFFVTSLHKFHFSSSPAEPLPSLEPQVGIFMKPQPYKIVAEER